MNPQRVSLVGACGHIGLPLALVVADAGYEVVGIDRNAEAIRVVRGGKIPYVEHGAQELLDKLLPTGRIRFEPHSDSIRSADVVVIIIGTPIDDNLNPRIDPLLNLLREIKDMLHRGQLIVLRSTVSPGTTELFKAELEESTGLVEGRDISVVFAPERVLQTKAVQEIATLPQLIGAFNDVGFERASAFFRRFIRNRLIRLTPLGAELGKLITNMARYVSFAMANEFYLIADSFGADAHEIIAACNLDYARLDVPRPGPNVGGPCLYKDGYYLLSRIPFPTLVSTAFKINESMPMVIVRKVFERHNARRVGVLGLTFKADCDDTRNSLSYKLRKLLRNQRCEVVDVDPYVPGCEDLGRLKGVDTLILMTPHKEFALREKILQAVGNPDCLVVDLWNYWPVQADQTHDGLYWARDVKAPEK
jgi:UDP-N-acetyl-D-mannosaminuronic acid dehydrogenase